MVWLKKEILFILSTILITLSSCGGQEKLQNQKEERKPTKEELISAFFEQIQSWNKNNISVIDSLGNEISRLDSSLSFLPGVFKKLCHLTFHYKYSFLFPYLKHLKGNFLICQGHRSETEVFIHP